MSWDQMFCFGLVMSLLMTNGTIRNLMKKIIKHFCLISCKKISISGLLTLLRVIMILDKL
jgi:hypothetical protein